jgi:hypothetical protein
MTTLTQPYAAAEATRRAVRRFGAALSTRNLGQSVAMRQLVLELRPVTEKRRSLGWMSVCLSAACGVIGAGR